MNAINIMQMINHPITNKASFTREASETQLTPFLELLGNALFKDEIRLSTNLSENKEVEFSTIDQLINEWSSYENVLNNEMLTDPLVEQLLELLPIELQLQITELFDKEQSLKDLLTDDKLQEPEQVVALLIFIAQNQQETASLVKVMPFVEKQMEKVWPMIYHKFSDRSELRSLQISMRQMFEKLENGLQHMTNKNDGNRVEKAEQVLLAAFSRTNSDMVPKAIQAMSFTTPGMQLNSLQQLAIHVGENQQVGHDQDKFIRQFQSILGKSSLAQFPNGLNQLSIKLFPEHLGRLDVKLVQQNGVIVAQIMATTQKAKSVIDSQLQQLRQAFVAQNIQVEKIEVLTQQQQQAQNHLDKDNQNGKNHHQTMKEQQEIKEDQEDELTFQDFLEDGFNTMV